MKKISFILFLVAICASANAQVTRSIDKLDKELQAVKEKDQSMRLRLITELQKSEEDRSVDTLIFLGQEMQIVDKENQAYVEKVLASGWPQGLSKEANSAIFLVIDHADLEYQKKYLDLVKNQSEVGVLSAGNYVTLLDRVLMKSGKPQQYGTQTKLIDNEIFLWPVAEPDKLNQMRSEVGLSPIEDYLEVVGKTYGGKAKWDKSKTLEFFGVKAEE